MKTQKLLPVIFCLFICLLTSTTAFGKRTLDTRQDSLELVATANHLLKSDDLQLKTDVANKLEEERVMGIPDSLLTEKERELKIKVYSLQRRNEEIKLYSKQITPYCDTLIFREICDYCLGENSYYWPHKYGTQTTCFCYSIFPLEQMNNYIQAHKDEIKVIIIENPSNIIKDLNLEGLSKLHTFRMFGNDYNCNAIEKLPNALLELPRIKIIDFDGVRFPNKELDRIKQLYPRIILPKGVAEYSKDWDSSINRY